MARRRDPLDGPLPRLCSLAEQATVLLRQVEPVRRGLAEFGIDADAWAGQLAQLAATGRAAHSDRLDGHRAVAVASEDADVLAVDAYDRHLACRKRLAAAAALDGDETAHDDLMEARARLRISRPQLTTALDVYRRFATHVARHDHPIHRHAGTAAIPGEVAALTAALDAALAARDDALRLRRIAVRAAEDAHEPLRRTLRRVRQLGEIVSSRSDVPAPLFSFLATRAGKPSPPPATTGEPTTPTGGCTTPTGGITSPTDACTTPTGGTTPPTDECTTPTGDATRRSNHDFPASCPPDDPCSPQE